MDWISVKDRLPKKARGFFSPNPTVILYTTTGEVAVGFIDYMGDTFWILHGNADTLAEHPIEYVTHWMFLPEPPKEDV